MTRTSPIRPGAGPVVGPRPALARRLKAQHPLRLFVWPALLLLVGALVLQAASTPGGWSWFVLAEVPAVFIVALALEGARRWSFSTVDLLRRVLESHRG